MIPAPTPGPRRMSTVTATTARHQLLANLAVNDGLVDPCDQCGLTGIMQAYDRLTLVCALNRTVTLDPSPTHLCVPPPPVVNERRRRLVRNLVESIADEVVDTWT